jgi:hypothetical protein
MAGFEILERRRARNAGAMSAAAQVPSTPSSRTAAAGQQDGPLD